ncbi:MAG: response regulator [Gammaproteobacteria bacterium]|nr:response regulator [Gammaproteobacteria bacterium]MBU2056425.1 response regulator [Gammaproteobacteria bacterium]MBU2175503.1 response regulator [Gammaproteobacteria bacterium]MBU2246658.1 response regulator [Gammaproteobacteria bacterium]MBU2345878.1 response regulator [Gammaproteobacteria bacterium]
MTVKAMDTTTEAAEAVRKPYSEMTVLVVDATDIVRETVVAMLRDMGFGQVLQAGNGEHALSMMLLRQVDLVLSEWQMPKMDGMELLAKIRADKKHSRIPFIMLSSIIEQAAVIQAIKSGVSEYVVKPFSARILSERVLRAIEGPVRSAVQKKAAGSSKEEPLQQQQLRILVVDDVVDNIQVISEILRKDYKVGAATSGEKALKICAAEPQPDLVLLDVMMPEMNGFEVCKRLKADPQTQHITVIFLTALDQTMDIVRGFELGAVDYITKPVNPPVVKARVKTHAALIQSAKEMRNQIDSLQDSFRLKNDVEHILQHQVKGALSDLQMTLTALEQGAEDAATVRINSSSIRLSCSDLTRQVEQLLLLTKQD